MFTVLTGAPLHKFNASRATPVYCANRSTAKHRIPFTNMTYCLCCRTVVITILHQYAPVLLQIPATLRRCFYYFRFKIYFVQVLLLFQIQNSNLQQKKERKKKDKVNEKKRCSWNMIYYKFLHEISITEACRNCMESYC